VSKNSLSLGSGCYYRNKTARAGLCTLFITIMVVLLRAELPR
jgi:hypothetical protein